MPDPNITDLWLGRLRALQPVERAALVTEMSRGELEMVVLRLAAECESAREHNGRQAKWLLDHAPRVQNLRREVRNLQKALLIERGMARNESLRLIHSRLDALEKAVGK